MKAPEVPTRCERTVSIEIAMLFCVVCASRWTKITTKNQWLFCNQWLASARAFIVLITCKPCKPALTTCSPAWGKDGFFIYLKKNFLSGNWFSRGGELTSSTHRTSSYSYPTFALLQSISQSDITSGFYWWLLLSEHRICSLIRAGSLKPGHLDHGKIFHYRLHNKYVLPPQHRFFNCLAITPVWYSWFRVTTCKPRSMYSFCNAYKLNIVLIV